MASIESRITPISFHVLSEDESNQETRGANNVQAAVKIIGTKDHYPAVIFDKICFSVNRSKQQGNVLNTFFQQLGRNLNLGSSNEPEKRIEILKSIDLNVPSGCIFGLLGPSSCGKTTLLRCLVGLLKPSSGSIRLFNEEVRDFDDHDKTGSFCVSSTKSVPNKSKVPGSNVGYMPQDLGIYEDFTIRQLLTMFGQYMAMESGLIKTRIEFMRNFLDLPDSDREISTLSGGQKRRVSFAIACLHMPPLIILDEPTVGVDPLLRKSIWKYLRRLADEENKTIIITTHYIEEASQADQVALMRAGQILIQDSPKYIIKSNGCKTLEEAFLKICSDVESGSEQANSQKTIRHDLQSRLKLHDEIKFDLNELMEKSRQLDQHERDDSNLTDQIVRRLQEKAQEKLAIFEYLQSKQAGNEFHPDCRIRKSAEFANGNLRSAEEFKNKVSLDELGWNEGARHSSIESKRVGLRCLRRSKLIINETNQDKATFEASTKPIRSRETLSERLAKSWTLMGALLYKNYRRNVNSLPLLAFQFMLPIIQMISFSLCVGGRPTNIGLGLVNNDQLLLDDPTSLLIPNSTSFELIDKDTWTNDTELLSARYLSFLDHSMLKVKPYEKLSDALNDVRLGKLWAAMVIGQNFTSSISKRFDLEFFYQLETDTIHQSVIKLYPDRSNKVLDMICHRSLTNSYRMFLLDEFEHFKRLPLEVKEPIFEIKPNLISNSIDGYTESIAAGLLASLTYIMAAGLTTFIMVVERSAGILERTYTTGISPVSYLLAHALFRSIVMMVQIAVILFLTFYLLQQPLVGSIWLAYSMLMILNLTGISYGLLISSMVTDQNGAALTVVSSLVVKITMSGILWPFESIPRWLRAICYMQPLTMPVQALKSITLKGNGLGDSSVYLGFVVSLTWLILFLTISAKRFKFYQH